MSKHSAAFHYLRLPPFPSQHKNSNPLKTRFIANKVVLSLLLCSFSRFTAELSSVTQRWRVHFSSSKGNKHGRWTGEKLIFTIILITFRRFYCTGTFQNICLSRWAHKNMCVRCGRASFEKDGSIFKRARAAAACSGAAQAGGGGRRNGESAQFLPQERRGGGRRPHFHPPAIFGGGFFLPGRPRTYSVAAFICTIRLLFHGSVFLFLSFCFCSLKKEIVLSDPISTATLRRCKAGSVGSIMTKVGEVPTCLGLGPASSLTKTETKMNTKTKAATFNASSENALTYFYFK